MCQSIILNYFSQLFSSKKEKNSCSLRGKIIGGFKVLYKIGRFEGKIALVTGGSSGMGNPLHYSRQKKELMSLSLVEKKKP